MHTLAWSWGQANARTNIPFLIVSYRPSEIYRVFTRLLYDIIHKTRLFKAAQKQKPVTKFLYFYIIIAAGRSVLCLNVMKGREAMTNSKRSSSAQFERSKFVPALAYLLPTNLMRDKTLKNSNAKIQAPQYELCFDHSL